MEIITYDDKYKNQVIALVLYIQNIDSGVDLSLEEQPDLSNILSYYMHDGGGFWIALDENKRVIGTLGLMKKENNCGVLKKFFVSAKCRGREFGVSEKLFEHLLEHAKKCGMDTILLDTPSVAMRSHEFYKKKGFVQITKNLLPVQYEYPDRDSLLFIKKLK
jgi:N-acetylglutamate synthase-like GNAT family acetyltransferase